MARKLTTQFVRAVTPDGKIRNYGDGRGSFGLALRVHPNGVKNWYQHIRINDRETNIGLGSYPLVSLANARAAAFVNARVVRNGGDPRAGRGAYQIAVDTTAPIVPRDPPFATLADRTRRNILDWVRDQPATVETLVDVLGLSPRAGSKHLQVLEEVGLVRVLVDGELRWYELDPAPLANIIEWLEPYAALWETRLAALERHLKPQA